MVIRIPGLLFILSSFSCVNFTVAELEFKGSQNQFTTRPPITINDLRKNRIPLKRLPRPRPRPGINKAKGSTSASSSQKFPNNPFNPNFFPSIAPNQDWSPFNPSDSNWDMFNSPFSNVSPPKAPASTQSQSNGIYSEWNEPWMQKRITSSERNVIDTCDCGRRNGLRGGLGRVISGYNTIDNEYPWQTYLMTIEKRYANGGYNFKNCGGSIINDWYILTAAHCMVNETPGQWRKVKNVNDIIGKVMTRNSQAPNARKIYFEKVIVHPGYLAYKPMEPGASAITNRYDIALLKLKERLILDSTPKLKPVCLPESNDNIDIREGIPAKLVGWGITSREKNAKSSDYLLQITFAMHNASTCDKYSGGDASRFVCGEDLHKDEGSAPGDSGGPLCIQMDDENKLIQIGIVSFTYSGQFTWNGQVTETFSLGYYSDVMSFLPFIDYYSSQSGAKWCQRLA